ncbi:MAG TPA: hypothetical protein VH277_13970 [Gemmatimonadaceae bacterium]|nr:hypothetical protein [Gemmatimonadaceae bacterium]
MKTITDSAGTQWTVFEVKRQGGKANRWTYLPEEYGDGWLCFESDVSKRRLTPVPSNWRSLSDPDLIRLLGQAQTVNRPKPQAEDRTNA